jgi:hypothetical protein
MKHQIPAVLVFNALLEKIPESRKRIFESISTDINALKHDLMINKQKLENLRQSINGRFDAIVDTMNLENDLTRDPNPELEITGKVKG